jgi:hypothetical protein
MIKKEIEKISGFPYSTFDMIEDNGKYNGEILLYLDNVVKMNDNY